MDAVRGRAVAACEANNSVSKNEDVRKRVIVVHNFAIAETTRQGRHGRRNKETPSTDIPFVFILRYG